MIKEKEHWCCDCYYYNGDTSIGEMCDLAGESIYDYRPRNSHSCDKWVECICGPLNWEDVKEIVRIADTMMDFDPNDRPEWMESEKAYYTEVLKRFKDAKK